MAEAEYAPRHKTITEQLHESGAAVAAMAGGHVGVGLYVLRRLSVLRWHQLPQLVMYLVAGMVVLSVSVNQCRAVWHEWSAQERHTEWALKMDAECRAMSEFARAAPGTSRDCDNATTTLHTASLSRAVDKVVERWPQPEHLLERLSDTVEKKFYAVCIVGALFSLFWVMGGRKLFNYGRDRMHDRQHYHLTAQDLNQLLMKTAYHAQQTPLPPPPPSNKPKTV